jgi:hypothetical protein
MNHPDRYLGDEVSDRSRLVSLVLAIVLGVFGGHRFYAGRIQSGIFMALTLGGFGLWWLYDVIVIAAGGFRDGDGRLIADWEIEPAHRLSAGSSDLQDEIAALRQEVSELAERVDFTERLLADPERGSVKRTPGTQ